VVDADVCIVGAGYTGLWTAWALLRRRPDAKVVVLEARYAGFGASGRNGGWLSGLVPGDRDRLGTARGGRAGVVALQRHLIAAVAGVIDACAEEGIEADIERGGTLAVATTGSQMARLRSGLAEDQRWGLTETDAWELDSSELARRVKVAGARGGVFNRHCARIQPAKLVSGLAAAVERRGATIFEATPATSLEPGLVAGPSGEVRCSWVIRATEGYTAALPGLHRRLLPMNSSMIVTEPLSAGAWDEIGWAGCETLRDEAHVYVYLQRTSDGRVAIGGRGVPYRFGSRLDRSDETPHSTVDSLKRVLVRLFPALGEVAVARSWSGVLGVARDWCPSVGVERSGRGGIGWAGGYTGDGVAMAHLAGLTLADLVLGLPTERTALPWVGHASRRWEPEPLRWLGVRALYGLYRLADRSELAHPELTRTSTLAQIADAVSRKP
jgi:glycine/D-amino acid oxidase-like deaminating enzyme